LKTYAVAFGFRGWEVFLVLEKLVAGVTKLLSSKALWSVVINSGFGSGPASLQRKSRK
jgi:hypothetical protein